MLHCHTVKHLYKALCSSQLSTNSQYWETINPILLLAQIAKAFTPLFKIPEFGYSCSTWSMNLSGRFTPCSFTSSGSIIWYNTRNSLWFPDPPLIWYLWFGKVTQCNTQIDYDIWVVFKPSTQNTNTVSIYFITRIPEFWPKSFIFRGWFNRSLCFDPRPFGSCNMQDSCLCYVTKSYTKGLQISGVIWL